MSIQTIFKGKRADNGRIVEGRLIADDVIAPANQFFRVLDDTVYGGPFTAYIVDPKTVKPELDATWHNNLEEKPKKTDDYLCCCLFGERGNFIHKMAVIEYDAYNDVWECDYNIVISHWMELPKWPLVIPEPCELPCEPNHNPHCRPPHHHRPPHDKDECCCDDNKDKCECEQDDSVGEVNQ